ncbi:hypothetical protein SAMN05216526_0772 [Ectothiorhodosinus mongolicus]|uniref:Uncharacterized protein n=1 Tax=Ectothiorhodosinus mongolicus TaxID=233100 RepID=A0A1R3VR44_9GAMM|nr:hypothetical protein [Ectothiorhodosinus mongolicus]SIT67122.1 hypothetical protein SAMN05216526_0772 [Ectothiorhodosinus mongolicus]
MIELLQQRLAQYAIDGAEQQEQALKEMLQELTLIRHQSAGGITVGTAVS